jgi:AsmA protein
MKKAVRYTGFALGGLVVLVMVILMLAKFLITSEQVRAAVLPKAKEALQRDVALGDIDISIFSGIVLHDLTVMDKEGESPFVEAGRVVLRYRFWPLLRLKVVVDEVRLEQPVLRVVRHSDGTFNFSDLLEKKKRDAEDEEQAGQEDEERQSFALLVSQVVLSDGTVRFVDYRPNPDNPFILDLSQLNLNADNISTSKPFPITAGVFVNQAKLDLNGQIDPSTGGGQLKIQLADLNLPDFAPYYEKQQPGKIKALTVGCDLEVEGTTKQLHSAGSIVLTGLQLATSTASGRTDSGLDIAFEYDLQLDRPAGVLDLKQGRLLVGGLPVDLQGRLEQLGADPSIKGNATISKFDLATLPKILPAALLGNISKLKPAGFINGRFQLEGPLKQPKMLLKSGEMRLEAVQISAGTLRPQLTGNLTLSKDTLKGRKLDLVLGKDRALLDLTAENLLGKPIRVTSGLTADRLQLDALLGGTPGPNAQKDSDAKIKGKTEKRQLGPYSFPITALGTLHAKQALWRGMLIKDLSARYQLKDNIFTLEQLTGKTAGGTFSKTARIDLTKPGLAYRTHIETSAIQADPLLSALSPKMAGTVFGLLNLSVDMQGRGTGLEDLKKSLSGSGDFKIANGKITGAGLVTGLADFLDLEDLRVLRFSQAAGKLVVKDGRVQLKGNLAGEQVRLAPTGTIGLDGTLDVGLPVRLAPALTARLDSRDKFSRFLTDSQGWGELPLKVAGTVKAPRFALDTKALGGSIQRGVQQQLQKTLQEKLLKSRQGTSQAPDEGQEQKEGTTDETGTDKKATEEKLLEGVIKGLFGN